MENLEKKEPEEQQNSKSPILYVTNSIQTAEDGTTTISIYKGALTIETVFEQLARVKKGFPELDPGFYEVLADRIKALRFSNQRLIDAVNNLIDTCFYTRPTAAQILNWDKVVKVYTHSQMCDMVIKNGSNANLWNEYRSIETSSSQRLWAHITDIERYKLIIKPAKTSVNENK